MIPAKMENLKIKLGFPHGTTDIVVVGCGGTGSHLVPMLARLIVDSDRCEVRRLYLVDGDEVEEKNTVRQNFTKRDIGKNKARVLAERYSSSFGVDIFYVNEYLEDARAKSYLDNARIIIGCVDNNKTRRVLHSIFQRRGNLFYIDSGNGEHFGQVVIGAYPSHSNLKEYIEGYGTRITNFSSLAFHCPSVIDRYPQLLMVEADRFNSELSCAERAISAPQTIAANITAANIIFNMLHNILINRYIDYNEIRFDLRTGRYTTLYNTVRDLNTEINMDLMLEALKKKHMNRIAVESQLDTSNERSSILAARAAEMMARRELEQMTAHEESNNQAGSNVSQTTHQGQEETIDDLIGDNAIRRAFRRVGPIPPITPDMQLTLTDMAGEQTTNTDQPVPDTLPF
jgi:PRTRC genetic system ThiF family protein